MGKALGKVIAAVVMAFVGAEIIKRRCPTLPRNVADKTRKILKAAQDKTKEAGAAAKNAFNEGYASTKL